MSKQIKPFETWVIRNKNTGEYFKGSSGKQAWRAKNHASAAWFNTFSYYRYKQLNELKGVCDEYGVTPILECRYNGEQWRFPYFKEQETWVHVNLSESESDERLAKAEDLLREVQSILEYQPEVALDLIEEHFNDQIQS